ncbi:uncharacterized protein [Clytia hemisphaerica]|uniref:Uncharacterized protein n=1 Tax=Clytia hemisphaerica TaxID=252671 RepID=A0A7M5X793_9CNID|eukprot:TCONS_00018204-protein
MKIQALFVTSISLLLLVRQAPCKHITSVSEIEDLLSLVKKTIKLKQNDDSDPNSTQKELTADGCIKKCRNNYMTALLDSKTEVQTQGADVFIKCFPACFIPKDHGQITDPIKCKLSCGTAFHNCYLKAESVESFTCVVGKDACEADCDSLKERDEKEDSPIDVLDSLERKYNSLAKLNSDNVFLQKKRMVSSAGGSNRCFKKCTWTFRHCAKSNAVASYKFNVCDRLQSQCNRQCFKVLS